MTYAFVALFVAMTIHICYFVAAESDKAINNTYNPRQELLANKNVRGEILSADGDVLAETITDAMGKETRSYPYDNLFAHIVGYSQKGKIGVESIANFNLLTSNAAIGEKLQNEMNEEKSIGDNIITTLDVDIQKTASEALGVYKGAIVVMEPNTGKVLAMVSKPDFNPNDIVSIWEDITKDDNSSVLLNRATQGLYPPGSTFKIITALEYMRENADYRNYSYNCNGKFTFEGETVNCYHGSNHGSIGWSKAFAKSCNSAFANMGAALDPNKFTETCNKLLFNKEQPIDLTYSKSSFVLNDDSSPEEVLHTAIGQGKTQMTPMHMAMVTAAIANEGTLMTPYVIDKIETYKGAAVKQYTAKSYGSLMLKEEAATITDLMVEVVQTGTATKLKDLSYTAAGKTGSAEYGNIKGESHAWFTGFAPAESPEVVVTIIVEGAGAGGDYAVPIAKRIFDAYFE